MAIRIVALDVVAAMATVAAWHATSKAATVAAIGAPALPGRIVCIAGDCMYDGTRSSAHSQEAQYEASEHATVHAAGVVLTFPQAAQPGAGRRASLAAKDTAPSLAERAVAVLLQARIRAVLLTGEASAAMLASCRRHDILVLARCAPDDVQVSSRAPRPSLRLHLIPVWCRPLRSVLLALPKCLFFPRYLRLQSQPPQAPPALDALAVDVVAQCALPCSMAGGEPPIGAALPCVSVLLPPPQEG